VLISDSEAEHLPGCNLAVRKDAIETIGGFDRRFRVAGDDVDFCWRLRDRGLTLGFHPAAMVWHDRRQSLRAYLRQQRGYGEAEALLASKWPSRYNAGGHATWRGRVYGGPITARLRRGRPAYGTWGSHLFQPLYEPSPSVISALPLMPEWYLAMGLLALLATGGLLWPALLAGAAVPAVMLCVSVYCAVLSACNVRLEPALAGRGRRLWMRAILVWTYLIQPLGRLQGRLSRGLLPGRGLPPGRFVFPMPRDLAIWSEQWHDRHERLEAVEQRLIKRGAATSRGGVHDRWDLAVRGGLLGSALVCTLVEEHGGGRQMVRARLWPRWSRLVVTLLGMLLLAAADAAYDGRWVAAALLAASGVLLAARAIRESGVAIAVAVESFERAMGAGEAVAVPEPDAAVPSVKAA
jgi:hypothetical protein